MPTLNPRVNVTLKPHEHELLGRLAKHQGTSRAAIVREIFEQVIPVLERVVVLADATAKATLSVKDRLREAAERAERDMLPVAEQAMGQLDIFVRETVQELERVGGAGTDAQRPALPRTRSRPPASNHGGQVRKTKRPRKARR